MVLGRGFESWLCLKLDGKDGPLDGRKLTTIIKTAKWGKSHQKYIYKKHQYPSRRRSLNGELLYVLLSVSKFISDNVYKISSQGEI